MPHNPVGAASSRDDNAAWCAKYVGIPFADHGRTEAGCDCWGLARLVYQRERGILLSDCSDGYITAHKAVITADLYSLESAHWREVTDPQPFDLALIRIAGIPRHVGIVIAPGRMLHIERGKDSVVEDYTRPGLSGRIEAFYRHIDSPL
ncbi:MAG: C40 family peptidase [Deltaproteobacteria bacterium]|nr:C40 family peptidase [Deltaproteobacteria bacterium]